MRISSAVTSSSSAFGSKPNSRTTKLVEKERNLTTGFVIFATNSKGPTARKETFSGFCMAIFFGTSSPSTREK